MSKTILTATTAALVTALSFDSGAHASPLGATRAALGPRDMLVQDVALRGGGARCGAVRVGGDANHDQGFRDACP